MSKLKVTVVGGSNSAHTIIPILSSSGNDVSLLTRNPDKWNNSVLMNYVLPDGTTKSTLHGALSSISNDPSEIIPHAQIIILSVPVSSYREILNRIGPFIRNSPDVFIGTIYGQGGFNWMVEEIKTRYNLDRINYFAIGLIPWITRTLDYGKVGINYGPKAVNVVALSDKRFFEYLNKNLLEDLCFNYFGTGKFVLADNFLSLSLSVDNQIIHLSRLYSLYLKYGGVWKNKSDVPLFYKDYDDLSADMLKRLDDDYSLIREAIIQRYLNFDFKYMLNYLDLERLSYNSCNENIKESFIKSETLGQIPTPVVMNENGEWIFNRNHRFFTDDLYYGLAIAKWIAEQLNINVSTIDEIINWAQKVVGDTILKNNELCIMEEHMQIGFKHGIPSVYGFHSVDDIVG